MHKLLTCVHGKLLDPGEFALLRTGENITLHLWTYNVHNILQELLLHVKKNNYTIFI